MKRTIVKISFWLFTVISVSAFVILVWNYIHEQMLDPKMDYEAFMTAYVAGIRWECNMLLVLLISIPSAIFSQLYLKCNPR